MYRVKFRVITQTPAELPLIVKVSSETLRASGCITVEKPSWILASCSERVMVRVYVHMLRHPGELIGFEGVGVLELEAPNPVDVVKLASILVGALERAGVGVVVEGG